MPDKILLVNGPNLNLLGERQPDIYGRTTLPEIESELKSMAAAADFDLVAFQSNHEGEIIDFLHTEGKGSAGLIINAGALSHYSYAIRDAVTSVGLRAIEVHISNVYAREPFRHNSVLAPICVGQVCGLGIDGYRVALNWFLNQKG